MPLPGEGANPTLRKALHIVLDPGHGGGDEGTVYRGASMNIAEKEITLSLAYAVGKQLRNQGYQVTLTRESDRELALPARTALANRLKADLFISIHMNSSQISAQGIETYILNHTTDAASKRLAHLENSIIFNSASGSEKDPDVALILKDLQLDANFAESKQLACLIQENLISPQPIEGEKTRDYRKINRGVKQALFHVLLGADMPSVLVEAGFLSHPEDRSRVLSPQGQLQIGRSITAAVQQFFRQKKDQKVMHSLGKCKII